ncbi:MAG: hypothetical protein P8Q94_01410 [Candidatus Poseidoniaceae archaeon]|nr:hypothetical protein [Candidatus Poseidoniaceae archaeon]
MPLVEDNIDTHDERLTGTFWDRFSLQKSGGIIDDDRNTWVIFHEDEFNMLIYHYESIISSPIGRILHNSAADSLELINADLANIRRKFFGKKRLKKILVNDWELYGWGVNNFHDSTMKTNVFASVAAGFFLSTIELMENCRYKLEWSQKSSLTINFKRLPANNEMPSPNLIKSIPWAYQNDLPSSIMNSDVKLESKELGWSIEGRTSFLLPCDFFNRVIFNSSGFVEQFPQNILERWDLVGFDKLYSNGLIAMLEASKEVFLSNDNFVYLRGEGDWSKTIDKHMTYFGYVAPVFTSQDQFSTNFEMNLSPSLPLSLGKLVGLWERANGKTAKCRIVLSTQSVKLAISPLLTFVLEDSN